MSDITELKRLAEAFPDYDYDSNTEPFFNGPSGESLGGGSTGFYCVYGPEFEIDGESYDGVTLVESCPADQAKFICSAKAGILSLIAENKRLNAENQQLILLECYGGAAQAAINLLAERDQLKAENEALRKDAERYQWLRDKSEAVHQFYLSVPLWFTGVRFRSQDVDNAIDAMSKGEQS